MAKVNIATNWIRDIYYDPCDPNPWIFLELAFPALLQALWEYLQWDWEDYYEGTRGKSWQKDLKNVIRGSHWQPPKAVSRGLMFLFIAEAGIQRIGWMFLVAEIVANAFIQWSSLILSLPKCNEEITSDWGSSRSPIDGRPLNHDWMTGPSWTVESGTMFPFIGARWDVPPGGAVYYTTFQRYANFFSGEELKFTARIIDLDTNEVMDSAPENDPSSEANRSSAMHGKIKNVSGVTRRFEYQVRLSDGQSPLIWHCVGDFVSVRIFQAHVQEEKIYLPYVGLPQPSRRTAKKRPWNKSRPVGA